MNNNKITEYDDAEVYDAEYGEYNKDFEFFLSFACKFKDGRILDLACGTGRLAIYLANKGLQVSGIDNSLSMLELAKRKSQDLAVKWLHGDMRNFFSEQKFTSIFCAGNAFQSLLTEVDQRAMLCCIYDALEVGGIVAFNMRSLAYSDLSEEESLNPKFWHTFKDSKGQQVAVYGHHTYNSATKIVQYRTLRVWSELIRETKIQLKFSSFDDVRDILQSEGFKTIECFSSPAKDPLTPQSQEMYFVAYK